MLLLIEGGVELIIASKMNPIFFYKCSFTNTPEITLNICHRIWLQITHKTYSVSFQRSSFRLSYNYRPLYAYGPNTRCVFFHLNHKLVYLMLMLWSYFIWVLHRLLGAEITHDFNIALRDYQKVRTIIIEMHWMEELINTNYIYIL